MDKIKTYLNQSIFVIGALLLVLLVATVTWQVFSRYALRSPSIFTDELARFLLMWIAMLGISYAFGTQSHLSMDYLHTFLSKGILKLMRMVIFGLTISFIFLVMIVGGGFLSVNTMQQMTPVLQIPMGVIYLALPISGIINIFYLLLDMIKELNNKEEVV